MTDTKKVGNIPLIKQSQFSSLDLHLPDNSVSYDIVALRKDTEKRLIDTSKKSTTLQASFTLFSSFVGTGLLSVPYSFRLVGLGPSILCMIFIGFLTYHCLSLVLAVAGEQPANERPTLELLTHKLLGNAALYIVQISISLLQIGICTVILMFSTNFLNYALCNFGIESLCDNIPFRVVVVLIVTLPLTMVTNPHWFYITSSFSTCCVMLGLVTQLAFNFNTLQEQPLTSENVMSRLLEFKYSNLPQFFGVAIYTFEGIGTLFSVRSAMETPSDLPNILKYQMILIVFLYIGFPSICFLTFQDHVPEIMIFTLPITPFYLWVQIFLVMSSLCGYSLQLFPTLKILENSHFLRNLIFDEKGNTKNKLLRFGGRVIIIFAMLGIVFSGLSFNLWISFIGSFVSTFIGFVLPVLLYQKQFGASISRRKKIMNRIALSIGVTIGIIGVGQTLGVMLGIIHARQ